MQTHSTEGTVPVKHQIADALRAQILMGQLAPGAPLPTIEELSSQWRCAPLVAREALDVLKSEGRVSGGRGKRATVRVPPKRIKLSTGWVQEQKDLVLQPRSVRSHRGAIELTAGVPIDATISTHKYDAVSATEDLALEFGIKAGTEIQQRTYEMVDRETGHRLAFSVSYIPLALIESNPALLDERNEPWPGGHQHQLYTVGIEIDHVTRTLIAVQPTPGDRQKWGIEQGVSMLQIRSRSVDIDGRVVELSDALYPADRTEVEFTENLRRWPDSHQAYDSAADD
ncbi:GntR family transcriptional regulator [Catellatospora sp. KI3]|uniref:GntR family transcriptional regulator n=1 Tax=Catellatospora sp. KI3 TaxID=3041620 RepID=UPI002482E927|nr:GntR family transcriptional regulator [Catellatospora sp. KI3]MDI1466284.1 GntR family transcriptional regulator [Catellatospora sp. KI3]